MLTDRELEEYFDKHGLSEPARNYIREAHEAPSRLVGTSGGNNVVSGYQSAKGGVSIQTESRTVEHAYAIELEYSELVIEFWDQAPAVDVIRTSRKGKPRRGQHWPDFVVINKTGPAIREVKKADKIEDLLQTKPADWIRTESGVTFRPAAETFAQLGLAYEVVSSESLNTLRTDNLKLLLQARKKALLITDEIRAAVDRALSEQAWMSLAALATRIGAVDHTPLLQLINEGTLHAFLSEALLSKPESALVAQSPVLLAMSKELNPERSTYEVPLGSEPHVSIKLVPSGKQASRGLANLARLDSGEKSRSQRRWKGGIERTLKRGEATTALRALLPAWENCGNRTPRLRKVQVECLNAFIKEAFADGKRPHITAAHKLYKKSAELRHPGLPAVTRPTLKAYIAHSAPEEIAEGRGGKRAANAAVPPSPVGERQLLATRPFQLGTMDHYLTDLHCILARLDGIVYTARPWLTVLLDIDPNYVLAFWLSFRAPSRRACAMAIRQCVRAHGRLPEEIVIDRGPEFESVYFPALLAHCDVGPVWRPSKHPRYGSQAERFFGQFKTQWLSLRPGNTASYREARAVDRSHAPSKLAVLTIEQLLTELLAYCEWRNLNLIGLTDQSPAERVAWGLRTFSCSGAPVVNDHAFMIASAVDVRDCALDSTRGLHIGPRHYWHPELRKLATVGRVEEVREEPEDPYRVYARVDTKWVTCLATGAQQFLVKDPVQRLAEAIRIGEGQTPRTKAKEDADQLLIGQMVGFDARWAAEASQAPVAPPATDVQDTQDSILERTSSAPSQPLATSKW